MTTQRFGPRLYLKEQDVNYLSNQAGMIVSRTEWQALKRDVDSFFAEFSDEEIKAYNDEIASQWKIEKRSVPKEKKKIIGYVYFVLADNGRMKIGKTSNLKSRMNTLIHASANQLQLIAYFKSEDYSDFETEIHDYLFDKKSHGEWFDIDKKDIEDIEKTFDVNMVYLEVLE